MVIKWKQYNLLKVDSNSITALIWACKNKLENVIEKLLDSPEINSE